MGLIDNVNVNVGGNGNIIDTLSTYVTKVLKPNIVDGENVLMQEMMSAANTKYVIKYDYVLSEDITVPANCVLEFDGGSISGEHTITGSNTGIEAGLVKIFGVNVTLAGSWNVVEIYPEWFGAKGDQVNDDTLYIKSAVNAARDAGANVCLNKKYLISDTIYVYSKQSLYGTQDSLKPYESTILSTVNKPIIELLPLPSSDSYTIEKITIKNLGLRYNDGFKDSENCIGIKCDAGESISVADAPDVKLLEFENISVVWAYYGLKFRYKALRGCVFNHIFLNRNTIGIYFKAHTDLNSVWMNNNIFNCITCTLCKEIGLKIDATQFENNKFNQCNFEGCGNLNEDNYIGCGVYFKANTLSSIIFDTCYIEQNWSKKYKDVNQSYIDTNSELCCNIYVLTGRLIIRNSFLLGFVHNIVQKGQADISIDTTMIGKAPESTITSKAFITRAMTSAGTQADKKYRQYDFKLMPCQQNTSSTTIDIDRLFYDIITIGENGTYPRPYIGLEELIVNGRSANNDYHFDSAASTVCVHLEKTSDSRMGLLKSPYTLYEDIVNFYNYRKPDTLIVSIDSNYTTLLDTVSEIRDNYNRLKSNRQLIIEGNNHTMDDDTVDNVDKIITFESPSVEIRNVSFEKTKPGANLSFADAASNNAIVKEITFVNCNFTYSNTNTSGILYICQNIKKVTFINCTFNTGNRAAFGVKVHSFEDVRFLKCTTENIAKINIISSDVGSTRPTSSEVYVGFQFFDTNIMKPIYVSAINGDTVTWVDATGTTV